MTTVPAAVAAPQIAFTAASRPMVRRSAQQQISITSAASFAPIPLPATGHVRKISLDFTFSMTCGSGGAVVAGDAPWNLVSAITLTDATGQPIVQPISGYNLRLLNKYLPTGIENNRYRQLPFNDPHLSPDYAFSATATSGTAHFRLDLELEVDPSNGYGCIPNLDSNAALQLKIDCNPYSVAFAGTGVTAATMSVVAVQHYWAPAPSTLNGVAVQQLPAGYGDFLETRYENQAAIALSENTNSVTARGGMTRGMLVVSRAAGVRTAFAAGSNVGVVFDNTALYEGYPLSEFQDFMRRSTGYIGADITTSYAPLSAGILPGIDTGVLAINFDTLSETRATWLNTKVGTLLQLKLTPGAGATQLEIVTQLMQVRNPATFYGAV